MGFGSGGAKDERVREVRGYGKEVPPSGNRGTYILVAAVVALGLPMGLMAGLGGRRNTKPLPCPTQSSSSAHRCASLPVQPGSIVKTREFTKWGSVKGG